MALDLDTSPGKMTAPGNARLHYHSWDAASGFAPAAGPTHGYPSHVHAYWDGTLHVDTATGELYPFIRKIGVGYPNAKGVRKAGTDGPNDPGEIDVTDVVAGHAANGLVRVDTVLGAPWEDMPVGALGGGRTSLQRLKAYGAPLKDPMVLARLRKYGATLNPDSPHFAYVARTVAERSAQTRVGTLDQDRWEGLARKAASYSAEWREVFQRAAEIDLATIDPDPLVAAQQEADRRKGEAEAVAQDAMAKANAALREMLAFESAAKEAQAKADAALAEAAAKDAELTELRARLAALESKGAKKAKNTDTPAAPEAAPSEEIPG